jgi:hypothetical protein
MKHLLNGVAIAGALMIAAPVWAQMGAPMTPSAPAAPPAASSAEPDSMAPAARGHHRARRHRVVRHSTRGSGKASADNGMTEQLNRQELGRIQGGGAPGMAPTPMPDTGTGPRPSGGTGRGR